MLPTTNQQVLTEKDKANIIRSRDWFLKQIERTPNLQNERVKQKVEALSHCILEDLALPPDIIDRELLGSHYYYRDFINKLLAKRASGTGSYSALFKEDHPLVQQLIKPNKGETKALIHSAMYISLRMKEFTLDSSSPFIAFLYRQGFTDQDIIRKTLSYSQNTFVVRHEGQLVPSLFAHYLQGLVQRKVKFRSGWKSKSVPQYLYDLFKELRFHVVDNSIAIIGFIQQHESKIIRANLADFVWIKRNDETKKLHLQVIKDLITANAQHYAPLLLPLLEDRAVRTYEKAAVYYAFMKELGESYWEQCYDYIDQYLTESAAPVQARRYYEEYQMHEPMSQFCVRVLAEKDPILAHQRLLAYAQTATQLFPAFLKVLPVYFPTTALPILMASFGKCQDDRYTLERYNEQLFTSLEGFNLAAHYDQIIQFCLGGVPKKIREFACSTLAKQGAEIIPVAKELMKGSKKDERILGALIAVGLDDSNMTTYLNETVDQERNDETRNILLEAVADIRFLKPYSKVAVEEMIAYAAQRKKLSRWGEKWLDESKLCPLYWAETGEQLDVKAIRFLLYRMKQAKGLQSDIEARQLIQQLDRQQTEDFALQLLSAFINSNANSKLKYYLTLCGLLGGDLVLNKLDALFRKSITDKRLKMAEYVLGALAMIGTDKALRIIEVISRKYASKKPKLSAAALVALDVAAAELGLTKDQLADRIIPDFGFEGMYKSFEVGGENYRAFIGKDFKLQYFNEDNKMRKSLPRNTDKLTRSAFRTIEKELRVIAKSQAGRLEKYLCEERTWSVEEWKSFFYGNPILFVYSLQLLWAVFDEKDQLITVFYCDEDTDVYDLSDNEVDLAAGKTIRLLHPLHINAETLKKWQDKCFELSLMTIIPQLNRPIFYQQTAERSQGYTNEFLQQKVPKGADHVVSYLPTKGWEKETGDGGYVYFKKKFRSQDILAMPHIEGPAAWYQGGAREAIIHDISFSHATSHEVVMIKDVPAIWYSEVLADIYALTLD